jgi:hypothetical protein
VGEKKKKKIEAALEGVEERKVVYDTMLTTVNISPSNFLL